MWDHWKKGEDSIHSIQVMNTNTHSYLQRYPQKVLKGEENQKNKKYL